LSGEAYGFGLLEIGNGKDVGEVPFFNRSRLLSAAKPKIYAFEAQS
jgi:hypothetical protein